MIRIDNYRGVLFILEPTELVHQSPFRYRGSSHRRNVAGSHILNIGGHNARSGEEGGLFMDWRRILCISYASLVAISGPKKSRFSRPKKSQFSGLTSSNGPCNGCCPHQINFVPRHINSVAPIVSIPAFVAATGWGGGGGTAPCVFPSLARLKLSPNAAK